MKRLDHALDLARWSARAPARWWVRQSLRARLTLVATAVFAVAVVTGAVLLLVLQRYALTRVLDQNALKTARDISRSIANGTPPTVQPTTGGIAGVQVLDANDAVLSASPGSTFLVPQITPQQLAQVRSGDRIQLDSSNSDVELRVLARDVGSRTVVVYTDVSRIDDNARILTRAALIGGPLAVLLMAFATYAVVALTLRSVAALRHGAADITAAGLARQRLPVPGPQDEIHRLAVTLNAMLDRIDSATSRQRTFVGDAAHELRSPLASLRVQLEVGQRLGPSADWPEMIDDAMVDVERLDRLVHDLLALARLDEAAGPSHRQPIVLGELAAAVVAENQGGPITVRMGAASMDGGAGGTGRSNGAGGVSGSFAVNADSWDDAVVVDGDSEALRRVVVNLVNNAVRYANHEVVVSIDRGTGPGGSVAVLTVTDDGPGLPEDERERVFDRFYRVQESRSRETGGTGLGLPIVRDIARGHGGRALVTSRPDGEPGLRAVVELPLSRS